MPEQIDEAAADAAVDVEDEVGLLLGGEHLNLEGVVQHRVGGEVLEGELLEDRHSLVCASHTHTQCDEEKVGMLR